MDTAAYDRLTEQFARSNEAAAFVAERLASHTLGGIINEPGVLDTYLTQRKHIIWRGLHPLIQKAATAAIDLSSGLAPASPQESAFLEQVNRKSPLGQIGGITVTGNVSATIQLTNPTASWAGEQGSKPVSSLTFSASAMRPLKVIAQVVVSEELADLSLPGALPIVQRAIVSAAAAAEATALLDSTNAGSAGVKPASIINGVSTITPAGDFANNVGQVLAALSGGDPSRPVLIVSFGTAVRMMGMLRDLSGIGVRVVISSAAGAKIIGIDADGLLVTEGGIDIARSRQADVQMNDAPDSPPTPATVLVSTWQRNLAILRVERWVNWSARSGAVATLTLA
jgi:hypothetical protein